MNESVAVSPPQKSDAECSTAGEGMHLSTGDWGIGTSGG